MDETSQATSDALVAPTRPNATVFRAAILVAGVTALFFLGRTVGTELPRFALWVESLGILGPIVFVLGYAVAAALFVPGSLLTLAAGATFGVARGLVLVLLGATTGACAAFLVARHIARARIERMLAGNQRFAAIDRAIGKSGWKIVVLLRLSPLFPFSLLNYGLGLTKVRFRDYALASVGMVPATLVYVYLGSLAGDLATVAADSAAAPRGTGYWIVLGLGLCATIAVTAIITRIARKALKEATGA